MDLSQGIASRPPAVAMRVVALCTSAVQYLGYDSYIGGVNRVFQVFNTLSNVCVSVFVQAEMVHMPLFKWGGNLNLFPIVKHSVTYQILFSECCWKLFSKLWLGRLEYQAHSIHWDTASVYLNNVISFIFNHTTLITKKVGWCEKCKWKLNAIIFQRAGFTDNNVSMLM